MALDALTRMALKEREEKEKKEKEKATQRQTNQSAAGANVFVRDALDAAAVKERMQREDRSGTINVVGSVLPKATYSNNEPLNKYYSSADLNKNLDRLRSSIDETTYLRKRREMQTAIDELERLSEQVKLFPSNRAIYETYSSAYDNYSKLWEEFKPMQDSYNSSVEAYNKEYSGWKSSIRDAETISKELAELDARARIVRRDLDVYKASAMNDFEPMAAGTINEKIKSLTAELDALTAQRALLAEEKEWSEHFHYADLTENKDFQQYSAGNGELQNKYMTEDEQGIYNYLLAKEGEEGAQEYMDYMEEYLNQREGKEIGEKVRGIDNDILRAGATGLYGLAAGVGQFAGGIKQLFSSEEQPTSALQYGSQYIQEDLEDSKIGKYLYGAATTVGNMAPSILTSVVTGGLGAPAGVASAIAAGSMGASASGNAYGEKLKEGYSPDQARTYSVLVGASEGTLQYLLGGIGKLGGITDDLLLAKVNAIDNAFARVSLTAGVKLGSEITEEELQNFIEPLISSVIFNEEYDAPTVEELVETAIITALSTGTLESGSIVAAGRNRQLTAPASVDNDVDNVDTLDPLEAAAREAAALEEAAQEAAQQEPMPEPAREEAAQDGQNAPQEPFAETHEETPAETAKTAESEPQKAETPLQTKRQMLRDEAEEAGIGEIGTREIGDFYDEAESPKLAPYFEDFQTSYEAGRSGAAFETLEGLNLADRVKRAAWNAGRMDALAAGDNVTAEFDNVNENVDTPEVTPTRTEVTPTRTEVTPTVAENETVNADNALDNTTPVLEDVVTEQEPQYTDGENNEEKLGELAQELMASNRVRKDGLVYRFMDNGSGYFVSIERDSSKLNGMISDGRAMLFKGGPFATRQEAVEEALAVAKSNFYRDTPNTENTELAAEAVTDNTETVEETSAVEPKAEEAQTTEKTSKQEEKPKKHVPLNTDEELDHALSYGSGFAGGAARIKQFYENNPGATTKEATDFLKKEYGIGGRSSNLTDGTKAFVSYDAKGLEIEAVGSGRHLFTWAQVDARFRAMYGMASKPQTKSKTKPAKKAAANPQQQIADEVRKYIEKGQSFTAARLFEIADKAFGGTQAEGKYTVKDAYDGMELAVNQYLLQSEVVKNGNGDAKVAKATLKQMQELIAKLPTQTKRSAEMEEYQQFSTPPNIAYLAAWAANVDANDVVLEPSAGIGGLALWPKAWGATVYGNELSERRLQFLNQLGLDGTFNLNAEQIDNLLPDDIKPSVVIMNPPFSSAAGRMNKNDTANAKRHIEQALERLEDGGRLVAILGNGMADDAPGFKKWWDGLRKEYGVRANIQIDGKNYKKYGTTFNVQLAVIDKTGATTGETITGLVTDLSKIPDMMEGIRNDRNRTENTSHAVDERIPERTSGQTDADRGNGRQAAGDLERAGRDPAGHDTRSGEKSADGKRGRTQPSRDKKTGKETGQSDSDGVRRESSGIDGHAADKLELERAEPSSQRNVSRLTKEETENPDSVYSTYAPRKVKVKGAKQHPAKLVESAAMAAVEPPDPTYTPALPGNIVTKGLLSDAQLENVVYAGQAHSQQLPDGRTKGYFIGDGTGVGKGRQLAGIIMDNFLQGRTRGIWISEKAGLVNDARRDWKDLGGKEDDILDFSKFKLGQEITLPRGVMFSTYDTLKTQKAGKSRLDDLKRWLGEDFDGVICFDEAHNMANSAGKQGKRGRSKPSAKALAGIELQRAFPKARVVYASATGATDIGEYAYLERLGLWGKGTAFSNAEDFISKISAGGLAAMELVARDMKSMGVYMARSISYDDVTYDTIQHDLNPMQTEIYNTMSRAWQTVLQNMNEALEITGGNKNGMARSAAIGMFYTTQQRFYNQIITSMAMPSVIADMRRELEAGRSCVLQIVNTNAAQADRAIADAEAKGLSLEELDLTPSDTLIDMVAKAFPVQEYEEYTDDNGNVRSRPVLDGSGKPVLSKKAIRMRDQLLEDLQQMKVPDGPLEMLFDAFGVDNVAEVTGRGRRVVEKLGDDGTTSRVIEKRSSKAGVADAQMFQDGKKRILIFSDAGGTGRSYHADRRAKNQQQRVHYLLQPGWSASKATQGFGRTHRSNQASAPIFRLVTTNVMGQKRFTSTIARRLDQLGALTKGQRQAGSGIFGEKDNLEGPIAQDALQEYYKTLDHGVLRKLGLYDKLYDQSGRLNDGSPDLRDISKFLNRILSLEVEEQNEVFRGFYDTFERMMDVAIANGTVDMGLENYRADKIEVVDEKVVRQDKSGADTKYVQMKTYRKTELVKYGDLADWHEDYKGLVRMEDGSVRAVYQISNRTNPRTGEVQKRFKLESPAKGNYSVYVEDTLKAKTTAIPKAEWKKAWTEEVNKAPEYNEGTLHLLTGTLLPIWDRLPSNNTRVMRVISSDGRQYLGRVIQPTQIDGVLKGLGANRTRETYTPQQISQIVLQEGKEAVLRDNKVKIVRRRVSGEWRMEITGQNIWYLPRQYRGIIQERINFETRYFIPTGENGEAILKELMNDNPVVDLRKGAGEDDVDNMAMPTVDRRDQWTTTRVGDKNKKPRPLSLIVEDIKSEYGINITVGHIRGKNVLGQYNKANKGIRARIANDLPTIAHELGHHLDDIHGLTKGLSQELKDELTNGLSDDMKAAYAEKKWITEGLAEYVRRFLQNRETAAIDYPEFTKHFLNKMTGKDQALILVFADEINAYYSLDADTATSAIRLKEEGVPDVRSNAEQWKDSAAYFYQAWQDALHGIRLFDRATGADTYKLASNAAYSDSVARNIIFNELRDINGQYVGPGLKTVLHGLNMGDKKEYRAFAEYLVVKHGPERLAEGMRVFADDRKNSSAFMQKRQAELEQQYPEFEKISERLYKFIEDLYETWGVETGLIGDETFKDWRERWQFYVPFNRVIEKGGRGGRRGLANQDSTIRKARGSGRDIYSPLDNLIENTLKLVNAGARNNAMLAIADAAQEKGANATWLEKVPVPMEKQRFDMRGTKEQLVEQLQALGLSKKDLEAVEGVIADVDDVLTQYKKQWGSRKADVVTVLRDGRQEFWKINDPLLLESLTGMDSAKMKGVLDAYAVISRFMTGNITGNNVVWSIFSNAPRDLMTTLFYSKESNPLKIISAMGSSYINKIKDSMGLGVDPLYQEYLALGGGNASAFSADRNLTKNVRKEMSRKLNLNPLDLITYVSDVVESGPRFATYKLSRQKGMSPQDAFYAAMDITVNFRRGGRYSREVNKAVPFFNAGIQGVDKFVRWITAEDYNGERRKKAIAGRAEIWIAGSAILAAIAFAVNHGSDDDEENYERLSTFTKNSYWNFPLGDGKYFAIPKPRELAVLSSFMEAALSYGLGQNEYAYQEFYTYAVENFLPSIVSDVAQIPVDGIKEAAAGAIGSLGIIGVFSYLNANRDFLGRPIVSAGLEGLLPKDQYTERTSKMAYWLGQVFEASPQEIDYFCEQVLGGWWKYGKALWPVGEENRDTTLGVKNTYIKDSQYSTDIVNWLYDTAELSDKEKKSKPDDIIKAITAKIDDNMKQFYSRYYAQAKNTSETEKNRAVRDTVLTMIEEYRKAKDHGILTPAEEAVHAVCEEAGTTDFLPAVVQSAIKDGSGEEHQLSAIQYVEYQLDYNTLYWEYVENNLDASASHRKQAAILNAAKKIAAEQALNNTLGRIGAPKTDFASDYSFVDRNDLVQFTAGKALGDADGSGSLSDAELVDVILDMHLSDETAYELYFTESSSKTARAAKAAGIDADTYLAAKIEMAGISADKDEDGKSITGSRRDKIEAYLNSVCDDYKTYLWLLGTEYESVKKDADYIAFFGRQD